MSSEVSVTFSIVSVKQIAPLEINVDNTKVCLHVTFLARVRLLLIVIRIKARSHCDGNDNQ